MSKNVKTYERKALEGTPFVIHYSETHGWAAGIAEHKITGWYQTEDDLKKLLKGLRYQGINWDLMTGVILVLIEKVLEIKKIEEKREETKETARKTVEHDIENSKHNPKNK